MRKKQIKFKANAEARNVVEPGKEIFEQIAGNWHEQIFENDQDIVLELACGRGEYTVGLAAAEPHRNFIGVDIKGDRIYRGSQNAIANGLHNAAFLRTHILDLGKFFKPGEVSELWIVFPDPRPKKRDIRRRLTNPRYIKLYQSILKPGGLLRLKTDNTGFYEYTLEVIKEMPELELIEETNHLYESPLLAEHYGIKTKYEMIWTEKGENIKYIKFRLNDTAGESAPEKAE